MDSSNSVDALLNEAVRTGKVAGAVAGAVSAERGLFTRVYGTRDSAGAAMTEDSIFWIASMTKAITSMAAMVQVERGALSLDQPLQNVVPEIGEIELLTGFAQDGRPITRPPAGQVTLGQLLSHTSGFPEYLWHPDAARYHDITGLPTGATGKSAALKLPLVHEPGTAWQYGNSHDWVGVAVERSSNKRLDKFFADEIFEPLGMKDTTYVLTEAQKPRLAKVHRRQDDGTLLEIERNPPVAREYLPGGGGMFSTAADYLALVRMVLGGGILEGRRVLKPDTVTQISINRSGALPVSRLVSTDASLSRSLEIMPGVKKCWGAGFMVNLEDSPGGKRTDSLSWAGLGNTYFWIDPRSNLGGVFMTQILPFGDPAVVQLATAYEAAVYAIADRPLAPL